MSIYGIGDYTGVNDVVKPEGFWWGTVDAVSQYGIEWAKPGDNVLFPEAGVICRLAYPPENARFTLVPEVKLVCKQYPA